MTDPTKKAGKVMEEQNAEVGQALGSVLRGLPAEPVSSSTWNAFASATNAAVKTLSGGQADWTVPSFTGPTTDDNRKTGMQGDTVTEIPPEAGQAISGLHAVLEQVPEAEPYRFKIEELADAAGIESVTQRLLAATKDQTLVAKTTAPAPPPAPKEAPPAPKVAKRATAGDFAGPKDGPKFSDQHSTMTNI